MMLDLRVEPSGGDIRNDEWLSIVDAQCDISGMAELGAWVEVLEGGEAHASRIHVALERTGWIELEPARAILAITIASTRAPYTPQHGLFRLMVAPGTRDEADLLVRNGFDRVIAPAVDAILATLAELARELVPENAGLQLGPGIVKAGGKTERVTPREHGFLRKLIDAKFAVVSRTEMLTDVWGVCPDLVTNRVPKVAGSVRKKVRRLGYDVKGTIAGYCLVRT